MKDIKCNHQLYKVGKVIFCLIHCMQSRQVYGKHLVSWFLLPSFSPIIFVYYLCIKSTMIQRWEPSTPEKTPDCGSLDRAMGIKGEMEIRILGTLQKKVIQIFILEVESLLLIFVNLIHLYSFPSTVRYSPSHIHN